MTLSTNANFSVLKKMFWENLVKTKKGKIFYNTLKFVSVKVPFQPEKIPFLNLASLAKKICGAPAGL